MKKKLTLHFFLTLCIALITLAIVNIGLVTFRSYHFKAHSDEYQYGEHYINQFVEQFANYITEDLTITEEGKKLLDESHVSLQIINEQKQEVYAYQLPDNIPSVYTNKQLIDLYQTNESSTIFINDIQLNESHLTYLLFFPLDLVRRYTLHYNTEEMMMTHNIPLMLIVNCLIALFISYISTRYLVKPLNDIIQNIVSLSKGHYLKPNQKPSLYREVEDRITDLSQQLQVAQYERQQMDTVREEWIANISHDIKTPLTSIRGNAEIMADMSYEMDLISRQKSAQTIIEKSDYIKNLVNDLNLSTRLKNKEFILNKKQVNLVSLLRHVIIEIMNDPKYENYNIQFSYDNEYIPLMLDELLMRRVFTNLMMNAITHNEESVLISIDIKDHTITLKDNGVGVCEEDLLHIFKRYYRGTNTKKPNVGSGLGLAIAYDIVKLHEGIISASSTRGNGLTITITL